MFVRRPAPDPLEPALVKALSTVSTSTLGHLRDYGFPRGLAPLRRPAAFVGVAVTVRIPHLDSTAVHVAADGLRPGDVLVVDQSGDSRSCFGGVLAHTAAARGAAGAVLAGSVNDVEEIVETGLPVFSAGVSARTTRILGVEGSINITVTIGGTVVNPGDVIFADSDGIAVFDRSEAWDIANLLKEKEAAEPDARVRISQGEHLSDLTGAAKLFAAGLSTDAVR
ncbi:RraA family protein [Amycolatopsis saalfeldensis]|uniref:Putative 4-hydroxy-4-methyl-2-oxoglutarate aldolase n=1 Tax=Amycolatopsis saalfeldensis TaxID=394193 RepID=A0A1H8XXQ5_9PSEU|nr:dimethylmenaquinone methyltransferase [Amycolatopsis saalfeldensis]SEP44616.1 Regulator of RNase E activity RraA [Amycolatopsis saalfeldensis]